MDSTLISSFVKGGKMPLGQQLKTSERNELYQKLIQEYFAVDENNPGILKSWLLGKLGKVITTTARALNVRTGSGCDRVPRTMKATAKFAQQTVAAIRAGRLLLTAYAYCLLPSDRSKSRPV